VAERAGLPSLLVENFTWPWLYEPLVDRAPRLARHVEVLEGWTRRVTARVQTEPLCRRVPEADAVVPPIGRRARRPEARVREGLDVGRESPLVVLTMGGVSEPLPFLERLKTLPEVHFLVTGVDGSRREGNLHLFDSGRRIYLPDLIRAADAVVAKLGYSTVAEVWNEGGPLAFVTREDFRETGPVRRWVEGNLRGFEIAGRDFATGDWIGRVPELLEMAGARRAAGGTGRGRHGPAEEVARRLEALAGSGAGSATPPAPPG
jgi:HAMP domain-containing protein